MVADVNDNIGGLLGTRLGRADEALSALLAAAATREELAREFPRSADAQRLLANTYRLLGAQQRRSGADLSEVLTMVRKAQGVLEPTAKANPSLTRLQADLASCLVSIGDVYRTQKMFEEALFYFQKAQLIRETLARLHPNVPTQQAD